MPVVIPMSKIYITIETKRRIVSASECGDVSTVKKLLRKKINPDVRDKEGYTALAKACEGGHVDVVCLLLEAGADPNAAIGSDVTPLHIASKRNYSEIVKHLVLKGASLEANTWTSKVKPVDFSEYFNDSWLVLRQIQDGKIVEAMEEISYLPKVPSYAIPKPPVDDPEAAKGKKGKKGKKGGKKGKKKKKKK